jgi:hypothetical protein
MVVLRQGQHGTARRWMKRVQTFQWFVWGTFLFAISALVTLALLALRSPVVAQEDDSDGHGKCD